MTKPTVSMVVAALKPNYGIGHQGKMPWRLRKEIKYFKDLTSRGNNAVIMGRKTWDLIPPKFRPLPDRINVVLSRVAPAEADPRIIHALSLDDAFEKLANEPLDNIYIIGGAQVYNAAARDPRVTQLFLTDIVASELVEMDTFLDFDWAAWTQLTHQELETHFGGPVERDVEEGIYKYNYTVWKRS